MIDPVAPFLLFPDQAGGARLFAHPCAILCAETASEVGPLLARLASATAAERLWAAGGLTFEAGLALEPRLARLLETRPSEGPLAWFGLFEEARTLAPAELAAFLDRFGHARVGGALPAVTEAGHARAVARARALIAAGDIYQVNLTFPARVPVSGHPVAIFARLFRDGRPPYAALVQTGRAWWLSLSPELFLKAEDGRLETRPMKGTAPRGGDARADAAAAEALAADPKNRAENLMIVDLLRHDLARVAVPGSVAVPQLFAVETYPSVHQMTSTVVGWLPPSATVVEALSALFPCGSVTGAPKIRAIEVIAALEPSPRGIYCGAIGWIAPGGRDARFNVAIRTLALAPGARMAVLGLGSGIVADSQPASEWAECLEKARFLGCARPASLLETMRREPDGSIPRLGLHLARLARSAERFGFPPPRGAVEAALARLPALSVPARVRLKLAASGAVAIQQGPIPPLPPLPVPAALVPLLAEPGDWRLRHKTSDRAPYEEAACLARARGGAEAILERPDGAVTEATAASLFVRVKDRLLTPPLSLGLLPGVLRTELLACGRAEEARLTAADVRAASEDGRLFLGNALRGLFPARLVGRHPAS